ncbi:MAG TPA: response regulator [Rhodocyclaceae bacterium]|nr:response regulator [Rhodocyclaceae bacterium]
MGIIERLRNALGLKDEEPEERLPALAPVIPIERRTRKRIDARRGTSALIIDDSKTIVVALSRMLQPSGFLISEAYDGETGVAMARAYRPDLIFIDIVMPGMNGFAALRALRRDPDTQNIPVIMMSGNEHATEQFFGSRIPADDFMKKPFSRLEVFARIEGLLDERFVPQRRVASGGIHHQ